MAERSSIHRVVLGALSVCWALEAQPVRGADSQVRGEAGERSARQSPLYAQLLADAGPSLLRQAGVEKILDQISEDNLLALLAGTEPSEITAPDGRPLQVIFAESIGSVADELVVTPLTPCRLIDTRLAVGAFAANQTRNYNLIGPSDYSSLGGNAAGCGIPTSFGGGTLSSNEARGLILNVIAVGPAGPGNLRAWPTNLAVPLASIINYDTSTVANELTLQTCNAGCVDLIDPFTCGDPCPAGDLSVRADVSGTHLVVDVLGYLSGATGLGSSCQDTGPDLTLSNSCQNVASCTITNTSSIARGVVCSGPTNFNISHTNGAGTGNRATATLETSDTVCGNSKGDSGQTLSVDVRTALPSAQYDISITPVARFVLAANDSQTYFLNVEMVMGLDAGDFVQGASVVCILDP